MTDRRTFIVTTSAAASALSLGLPPQPAAAAIAPEFPVSAQPWVAPATGIEINPWVVICPDNGVVVRVNQGELGQGTLTSNPMMVCEELAGDWSKVRAVYADPNRNVREKNVYDHLWTGTSSSVRLGRETYQRAGADARERLRAAAAARWNVPVAEIAVHDGILTHVPTGRTLAFAAVAEDAAKITLAAAPAIKTPNQYTLIGKRVAKMFDVELKTYGQATFGIDVRLPNMLYAAIRQAPRYGAKLQRFDFDAIKARRGVVAAVAVDVAAFNKVIGFSDEDTDASGVAVIADRWWRAKTALDQLPIAWDESAAATASTADLDAGRQTALQSPGLIAADRGDVDAVFGSAKTVVEASYQAPYQSHAPMEPMNCTAQVTDDRVDLWVPTQCPDWALDVAAKITGIAPENVYVHQTFVGGSFGRRFIQDFVAQSVAIAKAVPGRPVKLLWSREEDIRRDNTFHPGDAYHARAVLGADGFPEALLLRKAGDVYGSTSPIGPKQVKMHKMIRPLDTIPYAVPNVRVEVHELKSKFPTSWLRGTATLWNIFALESFIDECAHAAGKDPYQYRRALLAAAPPEAFVADTKQQWLDVLDLAAKNAGWGTPLPPRWGRGIAIEDRRDVAPSKSGNVPVAVAATVSVAADGAVTVQRVDIACDRGLALIDPQAAERNMRGQVAWSLGLGLHHQITFENGHVVQSNFNDYPVVRMADYPKNVSIAFVASDHWIFGIGEELTSQVTPAVCNAIFAATGTRVRSLPVGPRVG